MRGEKGAERVPVGVLVGGEQQLVRLAQLTYYLIEVRDYSHSWRPSMSSNSEIRIPRSIESS